MTKTTEHNTNNTNNTDINIEILTIGPLQTNCYIVWRKDRQNCWIIDPGGLAKSIVRRLKSLNLTPEKIIITHGHWDHFIGNRGLKGQFPNTRILIHEQDADMLPNAKENMSLSFLGKSIFSPPADELLTDNEIIELSDYKFSVIHTPGHSPGSICLYSEQVGVLFSGDLIFADGGVGRTDLPRSSHSDLLTSLGKIFSTIPDKTIIYPGHGPETTVEKEKQIHRL